MIYRIAICMACLLLLTACPRPQTASTYHKAFFANFTNERECFRTAISSIEGTENIQMREELGGRPLTLTGLKDKVKVLQMSYDYQGKRGPHITTVIAWDGSAELKHYFGLYDRDNPEQAKADVDEMEKVLLMVHDAIGKFCKIDLSATTIRKCKSDKSLYYC